MIKNRVASFLGILMICLGSRVALGDTPTSPAGRLYSNRLQSLEFVTGDVGRVIENANEAEFSYEYDKHIISIQGDNLRPSFLRHWLIKEDGRMLVSADGRIRMSLVHSSPVLETDNVASDLVDVDPCPPSFCRGTSRCWYTYTASNMSCVVNYCHHTKSCE